jgi:hypothetical protein
MGSDLILRPGMVGVCLKKPIDPLGTFTTLAQGDTEAAHVWRVRRDGKIATTGAQLGILFGYVDAIKYLRGKTFFLLEPVDPWTDIQLTIMDMAEDAIKAQPLGRAYGPWRYWQFWARAFWGGDVKTLGDTKGRPPKFPICSQTVAYPLWKAGAPVGKSQGKLDWMAVLPETILKEAKQTEYELAAGTEFKHPCYYLRLVQDEPYRF